MARKKFKDGTTVRVTRAKLEELNRFSDKIRFPVQEIVDTWLHILIEQAEDFLPIIERKLTKERNDAAAN